MSTESKTVRRQLLAAGYLASFTALLHLVGGTIEIHQPLMTSQLPEPLRLLLLACWHLVSVALLLSGPALLWCARPERQASAGALTLFIGAMWLGFGAVFVVVALVYQGVNGLATLPQWTLLLPVGALATLGGRRLLGG